MSTLDLDLDYTQVDVGLIANDGTGSTFRTAGLVINQNATRTMTNFEQTSPCVTELTTEVARLTAIIDNLNDQLISDSTGVIITARIPDIFFQYAVLSVRSDVGLVLADPVTLTSDPMLGMAVDVGDGTNITIRLSGIIERPGTVAGGIYYLSDAGTIIQVTGTPEPAQRLVGLGVSTDQFLVRIDARG